MEYRETLSKMFDEWEYLEEAESLLRGLYLTLGNNLFTVLKKAYLNDETAASVKADLDRHFGVDDSE